MLDGAQRATRRRHTLPMVDAVRCRSTASKFGSCRHLTILNPDTERMYDDVFIRRTYSAPTSILRHTIKPSTSFNGRIANMSTHRHYKIFGRLHLVAVDTVLSLDAEESLFDYFFVDESIYYQGFCDDFGPMNLAMVHKFCERIDYQLLSPSSQAIALVTDTDKKQITNVAFLLGAYMIMRMNASPDEVEQAFSPLRDSLISFRDVSRGKQNFELHLVDCWEGLWQAKNQSFVDFGPHGFDEEEYMLLDDPLTADMHEVVKGKLFAMKGPKRLDNGQLWIDRETCERDFSPQYFHGILKKLAVRAVIRLNVSEYDRSDFERQGIAVADLSFPDCTTPPPDVVVKFLMMVERLPCAIAVHCQAGLGRTGTLIGLYLMKHHGFTARQAIGWLRIARPGSVIGAQQQYLCTMHDTMCRAGRAFRQHAAAAAAAAAAAGSADGLLSPSAAEGDDSDISFAALAAIVAQVNHSVDASVERVLLKRGPWTTSAAASAPRGGGRNSVDGGGSSSSRGLLAAAEEREGANLGGGGGDNDVCGYGCSGGGGCRGEGVYC